MEITEAGSVRSPRKALKGALTIPISPRAGFSAVNENSKLPTAIAVVVAFAIVYGVAKMISHSNGDLGSLESAAGDFTYGLVYSLLYFVILVVLSTIFIRGVAPAETRYSSNANVLAYWFAWRYLFSSLLVIFSPSLAISGENIVYLIVTWIAFLWFLILLVVALSVANNAPQRRCWLLGFVALLVLSFFMSFVGVFLGAVIELIV